MTNRPNYNLKRFQERNIATLKKEYGANIVVYGLVAGTATTNRDSGIKAATYTSYPVLRAVVMPMHAVRHVIQTISIISANKKVLQGGTVDVGDRVFIIQRSDISDYEITNNDWIDYDGERYDIKYADEYEPLTSWFVLAKRIKGVTPEFHLRETVNHELVLEQTVGVVKV
jgi:hypothetical protein